MNLVIPIRNDGNYNQLRFALRSVTTHHNIEECILVGGKPKWYTGIHIPFPDYGPIRKEENIRDKTIAGAELINGDFIYSNDDFILMAPLCFTWNKGLLSECLSKRKGNGSYTRLLRNTLEYYGDIPNVDCHSPMIMNSEGVKKTNFKWPDYGIGFKTCYSQENKIESVFMEDCKVRTLPEEKREWFSMTDDFNLFPMFELLKNKCKFEL